MYNKMDLTGDSPYYCATHPNHLLQRVKPDQYVIKGTLYCYMCYSGHPDGIFRPWLSYECNHCHTHISDGNDRLCHGICNAAYCTDCLQLINGNDTDLQYYLERNDICKPCHDEKNRQCDE